MDCLETLSSEHEHCVWMNVKSTELYFTHEILKYLHFPSDYDFAKSFVTKSSFDQV